MRWLTGEGVGDQLVLENVLYGFDRPNVLEIEIGVQPDDDDGGLEIVKCQVRPARPPPYSPRLTK